MEIKETDKLENKKVADTAMVEGRESAARSEEIGKKARDAAKTMNKTAKDTGSRSEITSKSNREIAEVTARLAEEMNGRAEAIRKITREVAEASERMSQETISRIEVLSKEAQQAKEQMQKLTQEAMSRAEEISQENPGANETAINTDRASSAESIRLSEEANNRAELISKEANENTANSAAEFQKSISGIERAGKENKTHGQTNNGASEQESQEAQATGETKAFEKVPKGKGAGSSAARFKRIINLPLKIAGLFGRRATSLFIEDTEIRLLSVKGKKIKNYATEQLESGLIKDGVILDPEIVSGKINGLFVRAGLKKGKKVTVCSTGLNCLTKLITIPPVPRSVLSEAIKRESERELPVSIEGIYLTWQVIQHSEDGFKIFVLAQNRSVVDSLVKTLLMTEIKPYIFDLAPLALSRLIDNKLSVIADIRASEADIAVVENGIPSIIRGLPFPNSEDTELKLNVLVEELQRIIKFYSSKRMTRNSNNGLSIFVTGELVREREMVGTLSERLGHDVVLLEFPLIPPDNFEFENYMVNVGSIIKQVHHRNGAGISLDVNLLPEIYRSKGLSLTMLAFVPLAMMAVALFAFMVLQTLALRDQTSQLETEFNEMELANVQQLQQMQSNKKTATEIQEEVDSSTLLLQDLENTQTYFAGKRTIINGAMELTIQSPDDLFQLSNVKYSKNSITLIGFAMDEYCVMEYVSHLSDIYGTTQVKLNSMINNGSDVNFNITIRTGE